MKSEDEAVARLLARARARVAAGWCQRFFAVDDGWNRVVEPESAFATHFCVRGALMADKQWDVVPQARNALMRIVGAGTTNDLSVWNDHPKRTQQDVLDAFDRAIAAETT